MDSMYYILQGPGSVFKVGLYALCQKYVLDRLVTNGTYVIQMAF